ncbi:MAG: carboxypeptidase regulatory-like domain-containing protein, partial [Acidobacteriota bacterium]
MKFQFKCLNRPSNDLGKAFRWMLAIGVLTGGLALDGFGLPQSRKSDSTGAGLSGVVTSQADGKMEGVLVTAKGVGGTVAVTVVTDTQGRYSFPPDRLKPGRYQILVRAVGYELDDPGIVEIQTANLKKVDLRLRNTRDLASQLSNVEWLLSVPGTDQQRNALGSCVGCHSIGLALKSTRDAGEWISLLHRMRNYSSPSFWLNPAKWPWEVPPRPTDVDLGEYLSTIDRDPDSNWKYELKTMPRPRGRATRVIITEYDLPRREGQPHDASVGPDGMVWYSDFGLPYLGRLDPRTGEVKEWRIP